MKLLTKAIEKKLPKLYANENKSPDQIKVPVKFFTPWSNWTWYATEYDPIERRFFGLVCGFEKEFGYFSLDELMAVKGKFGLKIERDLWFDPNTTLQDVTTKIEKMF
jgi:hypothetical protein